MFTKTEIDILECLASGWGKDDIQDELGIERKVIDRHFTIIRKALGIPGWSKGANAHIALCYKAKHLFTKSEMYVLDKP